jgi:asparagine synthetase B (glutamine-hydrolysing)
VPFCDHRLVEYVFNTPWAMKHHDGREKSLLRAASEDLLPESVLQRPKSAFPATVDTRYDDMLCAELAQIVDGDGDQPVRPFIDIDTAREVVSGHNKAGGGTWGRLRAEGVVRTNAWLKEYELDMSELL